MYEVVLPYLDLYVLIPTLHGTVAASAALKPVLLLFPIHAAQGYISEIPCIRES